MASSLNSKFKYLQKAENLDYSKGYNSYVANDVVPEDMLVLATDARISTLGRYKTRLGLDFYSVPAGEAVNTVQTSVTGASDQNVGIAAWIGTKFIPSATGRLTKAELNIKNANSATGPIIVQIQADSGGSPGTVLATSSIPASVITSSYGYLGCRFVEAPLLTSGTPYWVVSYIQADGSATYSWASTTNATAAKSSSNSGVSWTSTTFDLNYKIYLSTDGGTLGHFRAYKSDGTKVTLIAYKEAAGTTAVATVNDTTGVLTTIKTGLSSSATSYDFEQVQDVVYYVNGFDAPRKWDFTNEAIMGGSPSVAKKIKWHKNHMFLLLVSDPAQAIFSDTATPESFTSTNFIYIPAPKSNDPVTTWETLNDNLYFFTSRTKWGLFGSDLTDIVLRQAPGTKGSAAPDSVKRTLNDIYFASDDNVYRFNGSTDTPIFNGVNNDYQQIANMKTLGGGIWNTRYYLSYAPTGGGFNSKSWVFNINYDSIESNDLATYVQKMATWNTTADDGRFIQASNVVGALYYAELDSNSYNNLGRPVSWELRTKYDHFGQPASNKHVKRWYPRFTTEGNYPVFCSYDLDFAGSPVTNPVSLQGTGVLYGNGMLYGSGALYGSSALVDPRITIPGSAKYIQRRYSKSGVNNPVEFLGDTLYYLLRRPR